MVYVTHMVYIQNNFSQVFKYLNKISYCFIELNTLQKTVPTECRIYDISKFHKILGCRWRKKDY